MKMRNITCKLALAIGLSVLAADITPAWGQFGQNIKKPKVDIDLKASTTAVVPGESFELAIRFQIEDGWHIYWINSGDAGMPPRVTWTLPDGVRVGDLVFPTPRRYVDKIGLTTNVHDGEVILTAPVMVPDTFKGSQAEFKGKLRYLVCKEQCILGDKDLSLTLPVSTTAEPAEKELFEQARRSQPEGNSKYISISPGVKKPAFKQGGRFDLTLTVDVTKGHHIQSNKPTMESFVATDVFLAPVPGVTANAPKYPKPKLREVQYLGKLSEFAGKFDITIPMEIDEAPENGRFDFSGLVTYQVCTDGGQCYPPNAISFKHTVKSQKAATDDLIEKAKKLAEMGDDIPWQPWVPGLPEQLAMDGHIVFVEVWADWCGACKTNREMLQTHEVRELLDQLCVVPLSADYSNYQEDVRQFIESFGRKGPPLAVVYPPGNPDEAILLPIKLAGRPETLSEAIRSAGATRDCTNALLGEDGADKVGFEDTSEATDIDASMFADADPADEETVAAIAGDATQDATGGGDDSAVSEPVTTEVASSQTDGASTAEAQEEAGPPAMTLTTLIPWLGFALVGGLILNIMPCVLPVISIKILSFVQQAGESPRRVFMLGLTFAAGIVLSFLALATVIIVLKDWVGIGGIGWGFQFQSPTVVIIMTSIIFAFGLSLFGVFEVTLPGAAVQQMSAAEEREGLLGAFMKGVLATILATPCTAPFLGSALGVALNPSATPLVLFAIFAAAGIGMAFPYVLLTWQPAWLKFMPKPGMWMERFKQFMGFILMGTVVWLAWPLKDLIGAEGLVWVMSFLAFVGLAVWILGMQTPLTPLPNRLGAWAMALTIVFGGWFFNFSYAAPLDDLMARSYETSKARACCETCSEGSSDCLDVTQISAESVTDGLACLESEQGEEYQARIDEIMTNIEQVSEGLACLVSKGGLVQRRTKSQRCIPPEQWASSIPWKNWSKGLPEQLAADGHTVFVDFTATWCATCIANKKATVDTAEVRQLMSELGVIPMKADFTRRDPEIVEVLQEFQRGGVPLNVI
ncbi:MAG: protein-disulfide reductase DsbD domain-containing protein, partial [Phycisphaerae bacterium]